MEPTTSIQSVGTFINGHSFSASQVSSPFQQMQDQVQVQVKDIFQARFSQVITQARFSQVITQARFSQVIIPDKYRQYFSSQQVSLRNDENPISQFYHRYGDLVTKHVPNISTNCDYSGQIDSDFVWPCLCTEVLSVFVWNDDFAESGFGDYLA